MNRPIMVCCASRDRPEHLYRAVQSFVRTSTLADMGVYVDADQVNAYLDRYDWTGEFGDRVKFIVDTRVGPNASINRIFERFKGDYSIFGVTPDDSVFEVDGWDRFVVRQINSFPGRIGVVSPAHNDGNYCAYPYVSKEWVDIVGFYAFPEAHSFVWDTCIQMLGEASNIVYADENVFRMKHDCLHSENFAEHLKMDEHEFLFWCVTRRSYLVKLLKQAIKNACHPNGRSWGGPFYSHNGVDRAVMHLLPEVGFACDVGANDGRTASNTLFYEERSWTVLCVEPNPLLTVPLLAGRKLVAQVAAGAVDEEDREFWALDGPSYEARSALVTNGAVPFGGEPAPPERRFRVPVRTLDRLLSEADFPNLSLLTIDVEGSEKDVLAGIDLERWQPAVIVVETVADDIAPPPHYVRFGRLQFDTIFYRTER